MGVISEDMDEAAGPNLAEKIRRAAMGRPTLDVAQFQFIDLKEIAERYGARWPERRERVTAVARQFIARRIAGEDVMIPGADGFLVVFGKRAGKAADTAAKRIANDLNTFFIGTEDADIQLSATRREMNVEDLAQAFEEPPPEPAPTAASVRHGFQPMWDARRQAITKSFVVLLDPVQGGRLPGWAFETSADIIRHTASFDEKALDLSEAALRTLLSQGRKAFVGVGVHVSTLGSSTGLMRVASQLAGFDAELARYRVVRVAGVPPGFPRIYLEDIARTLRRHVANLSFGIHWNEPDVHSIVRLQPALLGFSLPSLTAIGSPSRSDLLIRVRQAAEAAHQHQTSFFVDGDLSSDLCHRLIAAGADRLASPQLWPVAPAPAQAEKWPAARLGDPATINAA